MKSKYYRMSREVHQRVRLITVLLGVSLGKQNPQRKPGVGKKRVGKGQIRMDCILKQGLEKVQERQVAGTLQDRSLWVHRYPHRGRVSQGVQKKKRPAQLLKKNRILPSSWELGPRSCSRTHRTGD